MSETRFDLSDPDAAAFYRGLSSGEENPGFSTPRADSSGPPIGDDLPRRPRSARLTCPPCAGPLEIVTIGRAEIDRCPFCHGVYLDLGELEQALGPISPTSGGAREIVGPLSVVACTLEMLGLIAGPS